MSAIKHAPQCPAHTIRQGSTAVSIWKWVDGHGLRYELTMDRASETGEQTSRYRGRFRADHINDMRTALDQAASWLQTREEHLAEMRGELERLAVLRGDALARLANDATLYGHPNQGEENNSVS